MPIDKSWMKERISVVRGSIPAVTDEVSTKLEALLTGQFSERQLTSKELADVAAGLIAVMNPVDENDSDDDTEAIK